MIKIFFSINEEDYELRITTKFIQFEDNFKKYRIDENINLIKNKGTNKF